MLKDNSGFGAVTILLIVFIVGVAGAAGWFAYHTNNTTTSKHSATSIAPKAVSSSDSKAATTSVTAPKDGTITGNASYPSSHLPTDEQVCASKITSPAKIYCDNIGARQPTNTCIDMSCVPPTPDLKYTIKVPAGDYYVYATAEKELPSYKAYYDEFSKCGNLASCPEAGHKQYITVTVAADATVNTIDPGDWYAN